MKIWYLVVIVTMHFKFISLPPPQLPLSLYQPVMISAVTITNTLVRAGLHQSPLLLLLHQSFFIYNRD